MQKWMNGLKAARAWTKKHAYGVTLGICLAVIVGTAVYVKWPQMPQEAQQQGENVPVGAEDENVAHLADVHGTASEAPAAESTASPLSMAYALAQPTCVWPLSGQVTRGYSADTLVYLPTLARYETHAGVDIAGSAGDGVVSPMSGTVAAVHEDALWGGGITITHPDGLESTIYGVKVSSALKAGLAVRAGETIGTVNESIAYEAQDGAHIHWTLRRDGKAMDPQTLAGENMDAGAT